MATQRAIGAHRASAPGLSCCRRAILFVGPAHHDPERVIRQRALQRLGVRNSAMIAAWLVVME
jgi:hypothetical protein